MSEFLGWKVGWRREVLRIKTRFPAWRTGWIVVPFNHIGNSEESLWRHWHWPPLSWTLLLSQRTSKSNSQVGPTLQPLIFLNSLSSGFTWTPLQLPALSARPMPYHLQNCQYKKSHLQIAPFQCASWALSALSHSMRLIPHVFLCLRRATKLRPVFPLCMYKLYPALFRFRTSGTPWTMIPSHFHGLFSCRGLVSLSPCFRQAAR